MTSSTSKSYRRQKFDYTKIATCLFCQLNSNDDFRCHTYNMFALFTIIKKVLFRKKWLLIIFTTYLYVYSMLSQLKHNGFFLFFVNRNPHIFPQKKARGPKDWDNNCDRYSNLTALNMTISANAWLISIQQDLISKRIKSLKFSS